MTLPARIAIVSGVTNIVRGPALQAGCASSRDRSLFYEFGAICYLRFRVTQSSYTAQKESRYYPGQESCLRIPSGKRRCPIIKLECPLTSLFLEEIF